MAPTDFVWYVDTTDSDDRIRTHRLVAPTAGTTITMAISERTALGSTDVDVISLIRGEKA